MAGNRAALIALAAVVLVVELLSADPIGLATAGDLGKGVIAIAMMGSVLFWTTGGTTWLLQRWRLRATRRRG